jgi:hypothetical protein
LRRRSLSGRHRPPAARVGGARLERPALDRDARGGHFAGVGGTGASGTGLAGILPSAQGDTRRHEVTESNNETEGELSRRPAPAEARAGSPRWRRRRRSRHEDLEIGIRGGLPSGWSCSLRRNRPAQTRSGGVPSRSGRRRRFPAWCSSRAVRREGGRHQGDAQGRDSS